MIKSSVILLGLALSGLLLNGCANNLPTTVKVPVAASCPPPHIPPKPKLPITNLQPDSSPDTVMKAYVATIEVLQGYNTQLLHILKSYEQPKQS